MPLDALDRQTLSGLPKIAGLETAYGVKVNELGIDQLFALYERTGFLYPAKAARLQPYMGLVRENWRRLLQAGDALLYVLTAGDNDMGCASISVWRSTLHGWTSQHLVSENPLASRAVILAGSASSMLKGVDESHQNWFRPENRFPSRVFGSMVQSIGDQMSAVQRHMYFAVSRGQVLETDRRFRIVPYDPSHHEALCAIAAVVRGSVYVTAEDFNNDVGLDEVNEIYRSVDLKRNRQIWLAYRDQKDEPIGAAIAYRGPLGVNLSFIENRCDLLLHPTLPDSDTAPVVSSLLNAASQAYVDFELDEIPVIADEVAATALHQIGGEFLRHYCQGIWLKDGQPRFYRHVDSFYSRLLQRMGKQGQPAPLGVGETR
jgi:hypothetical protein